MTILKRNAALAALLAFAAACGGGDAPQTETTEPATPATEAAAPAENTAAEAAPATGTVHEVRMVTTQNGASGVFEPATLTVAKGDVIRFIGVGPAVHNANFNVPENSGKANLPPASEYKSDGQSVDVQINMDPGTYTYVCDPHVMMGMKGTVTVQ
jgi:plastocyanin